MEIYIISWVIISLIIGAIGSGRNIGFWGAFLLSLLLSPLLGLIITVVSKSKETIQYEQELLKTQKEQQETLKEIKTQNISSIADDLKKIKELLDNNTITEEEFDQMKRQILNNEIKADSINEEINDSEDENANKDDRFPEAMIIAVISGIIMIGAAIMFTRK